MLSLRKNTPLLPANCIRVRTWKDIEESFILQLLKEDKAIEINHATNSVVFHNVENHREVTESKTLCRPLYIRWEKVSAEDKGAVPGSYRAWSDPNGEASFIVDDGVCFFYHAFSLSDIEPSHCIHISCVDDLKKNSIGRMLIADGAIELTTSSSGRPRAILTSKDGLITSNIELPWNFSSLYISWEELPEKAQQMLHRKYYARKEKFGDMAYQIANGFCYKKPDKMFACKIGRSIPSWVHDTGVNTEFVGSTLVLTNPTDATPQIGTVGVDYIVVDKERTRADILNISSPQVNIYLVCEMNGTETPFPIYLKQ